MTSNVVRLSDYAPKEPLAFNRRLQEYENGTPDLHSAFDAATDRLTAEDFDGQHLPDDLVMGCPDPGAAGFGPTWARDSGDECA